MKCKNCNEKEAVKYSKYSTGEFCSRECARAYSTKEKRKEINKKVSEKLKEISENRIKNDFNIQNVINKNNGKYKSGTSILKPFVCISCNDEFFSKAKRQYCPECSKIFKRKKMLKNLNVLEKNLKESKGKAILLLKKDYFIEELSIPQICEKHGLALRTVWKFLFDNGIKFRNFSSSVKLTYKNGRNISCGNNVFNSGYHITWYGKNIFYRSSYEKRLIDVFDKNKIMYLYENKRFKYYFKGEEKTYISDFYFPKDNVIIESKNKYLQKRDKDKIIEEEKSVRNCGMLFFLAGEKEIKNIEEDFEYLKRVLNGREIGISF